VRCGVVKNLSSSRPPNNRKHPSLIRSPQTGPIEAGVFRYAFLAGRLRRVAGSPGDCLPDEAESDEGEQFFGRAEGVHHQAGRRRKIVPRRTGHAAVAKRIRDIGEI
jgi:hypothetical protein